ncbi:MAG: sugar ABC transporter permease [Rubrobacteraceae bacterium]
MSEADKKGTGAKRQQRKPLSSRPTLVAMLMLAPALTVLGTFVFFPVVYVVFLSFLDWDLISPDKQFVGLDNYVDLAQSGEFRAVLLRTVVYSAATAAITLPLALLLAVFLNQKFRGRNIYRTILSSPFAVPLVGSAVIWLWLYDPSYGLINYLLSLVGVQGPTWLESSSTALLSVIIVSVWHYVGYYALLFLVGLQDIPAELYEAARIDGAGRWSEFWNITLPLLSPTVLFASTVSVIQSFQVFDQVYVLTNGGPANSTTTLIFYLYEQGFRFFHIGTAAAVSVFLLLSLITFTILHLRLSRRWVHYEV